MATTLAFPTQRPTTETRLVRFLLVTLVVVWLALFLLLPLLSVFAEALRQGAGRLPRRDRRPRRPGRDPAHPAGGGDRGAR